MSHKKQSQKTSSSLLKDWLFLTLIIATVAYLLPGVEVSSLVAALAAAMILGILNAVLKPLMVLFTLPLNFITLGLFTLVINAVLVLIVDWFVPGLVIANFVYALIFGIFISVFTYLVSHMFSSK